MTDYTWILLKDLPGCPAGTEGVNNKLGQGFWFFGDYVEGMLCFGYREEFMANTPDFFKKVIKRFRSDGDYELINCICEVVSGEDIRSEYDDVIYSIGNYFRPRDLERLSSARIREIMSEAYEKIHREIEDKKK